MAALVAVLAACGAEPGAHVTRVADLDTVEAAPPPGSWRPAPRDVGGLRVVATSGPRGFALHTAGGDRDFLPGVNLQSTTPGHQPGELAISAEHYRVWFPAMARLGIRALRTYTIHPPAFYTELAAHTRRTRMPRGGARPTRRDRASLGAQRPSTRCGSTTAA